MQYDAACETQVGFAYGFMNRRTAVAASGEEFNRQNVCVLPIYVTLSLLGQS